jgi:transposase
MDLSLLDPQKYKVDSVLETSNGVTIRAHTVSEVAVCPDCGIASSAVHSYYQRSPRDLPIVDKYAELQLKVRRFRCREQKCKRKTFAERLELVASYQQRTERLRDSLRAIGFSLGGEAGAALLPAIHMQSSADTLLRLVKATPINVKPTPRVLGIDDWAMCRGRRYGTILIDLETREPVELLPDRSADTVADWLEEHPGVEIVTRDRSTEYALGITLGAPDAQQIADRWHLLLNIRQMVERALTRVHSRLKTLPFDSHLRQLLCDRRQVAFPMTTQEQKASQASRARRIARFEKIQALKKSGRNILQIAVELQLHRETVRTFYYADSFPERSLRRVGPSILDPYLGHLTTRLQEGCENGMQLWREIKEQGFTGAYQQVSKWLKPRRSEPAAKTPKQFQQVSQNRIDQHRQAVNKPRLPGAKALARLLAYHPDSLEPVEQLWLTHICQDEAVNALYEIVQRYITMIREQQASALAGWVSDALNSSFSTVASFAKGIQQDYAAILGALKSPWSNGQVEGQVNRLKFLKRQMYGRASFQLLRARVLHRR